VSLSNNPIPEDVRQHVNDLMNTADYLGPNIIFSIEVETHTERSRPLPEAVADWYAMEDRQVMRQTWEGFANEPGADDFSRFLDRLSHTINSDDSQFGHTTSTWLTHLSTHTELRKASFLISNEAATQCEDRVSLTLNEMKKARLASDVESGLYDNRLPDLIALARGMFRLDHLEKIARAKVSALRQQDEIGVYLAYQVKLRTALELPIETANMRFFDDSRLTKEDLDSATKSVQAAEEKEFLSYLSTHWKPWQSVLTRLHGDAYNEAHTRLVTQLAGDEFTGLLEARLKPVGLENDSEAQIIVGAQLSSEIAEEINRELTCDFLRKMGLSHLITRPQPATDPMQALH
jgi:hypothetical protein